MKVVLINFAIFIIWTTQALSSDNLSVFDSLLTSIINEEMTELNVSSGDTVVVHIPDTNSELINYTAFRISSVLQAKGCRVFRNLATVTGLIFEIADVKLAISYSDPFAGSLTGSDSTARTVAIQVSGEITGGEHREILKMISGTKINTDIIKYNDIEELEGSNFSFTQGKRSSYSFWDRLIEPALITGSVIVIVLLFFTQRA